MNCKAFNICFLLLLIGSIPTVAQQPWMSTHVYYNELNRLEYAPDEQGNTIPDFSHVGYKYGDEEIPDIDVKIEISPIVGDDGQHIQDAINYVSGLPLDSKGYRGTVLLKSGTYQVEGQLRIQADGVVLRGEGQTEEGTVILGTGTSKRSLLIINGSGSLSEISGSSRNIVESYVPVGRKFVVVTNTDGYKVGDDIVIFRPGTQKWISDLQMDQIAPNPDPTVTTIQWNPASYHLRYERVVSALSGDTVFFRNPVVMAMEEQYGGGRIYRSQFIGRIKHVGIENILFKSEYASDTDEKHVWTAVEFSRVMHSWIREVTVKHIGYAAVSTQGTAKHISVINCTNLEPKSLITGARRYSFNNNGQLNLFIGCFGSEGRHDFVTGAKVCGPSAFVNSTSVLSRSDNGPHHRWATGILWDNIVGNYPINVQDRSWSGTGHGWSGANIVFWNCTGSYSVTQSPWVSAKNYNIGFTGAKHAGNWFSNRPDGVWEGNNVPGLNPKSLYLAQIEDRKWDSEQFLVFAQIDYINAQTLRLTFNKNMDTTEGSNPLNYTLGGSAGLTGNPLSAMVAFGNWVFLTVTDMGFFETNSTITIALSENIKSADGKPLEGNNIVSLAFPDLAPKVFSVFQLLNTIVHDYAIAQVSMPANIYLIASGTVIDNIDDLETAVAEGKAVKKQTWVIYEDVELPIRSLPTGLYYFYAADNLGRISERSTNAVFITNSTLGTIGKPVHPQFRLDNGYILFSDDFDTGQTRLVQLIDINGRIVFHQNIQPGETGVKISNVEGIHILRILSAGTIINTKIFIPKNF